MSAREGVDLMREWYQHLISVTFDLQTLDTLNVRFCLEQ